MAEINEKTFVKSYWNYYLELEEQFLSTKRFVEFDKFNSKTYSVEFLKLLQAVCSEIDVVAKALMTEGYKSGKINIQKWGYNLQQMYPNIDTVSVNFNGDVNIVPWMNWKYITYIDKKKNLRYKLMTGKESPFWWNAYNKVKHERTFYDGSGKPNYSRANQKNLIYAFAALFVVESLYLNSVNAVYDKSKLFRLENQ